MLRLQCCLCRLSHISLQSQVSVMEPQADFLLPERASYSSLTVYGQGLIWCHVSRYKNQEDKVIFKSDSPAQ